MVRVVQGRSVTISQTFHVDGVPTDPSPDTATVTVTRDDGTILVPTQAAAEAGVGVVTLTLTPTHTALLDRLTATWTATSGGQPQTYTSLVEVAGDTLFTLAEAKAIKLGGAKTIGTTFTTDEIVAMRTRVEDAIEDACGVAFVPRYDRVTLSGDGTGLLHLRRPYLRTVRWATVTGTALGATDLAALEVVPAGFVYSTAWTLGHGNIRVGFEHGMDRAPERVRAAALLLAKVWLVSGPVDDRVTTMSSPDTGITAVLATPGRGGSVVGVPEVDATIQAYRVLAFA